MTDSLRYSEMLTEDWTSIEDLAPRPSAFSREIRRLCNAILESALSDAIQFRDHPVHEERSELRRFARSRELRELETWLTGGGSSVFSLSVVCHVLGFSASKTQNRLADFLYGARSHVPTQRGSSLTRRAQQELP